MNTRGAKPSEGPAMWSLEEFSKFYLEYRGDFRAHASRILGNTSRADEIVQDAFLKVILAAPVLDSKDQARAYLRRTIENLCRDIFRLEGRRPNLVLLDEVTHELEAKLQPFVDHSEVIAAADDAALVRQALSLLSPAERSALVMWEIDGRSTSEIAAALGLKEKSVRHTVSRARRSLRRILTEFIIDEERGLTAHDIISSTYGKTIRVAKKSSKVAFSLVLVCAVLFGLNNFSNETSVSLDGNLRQPSLPNLNQPSALQANVSEDENLSQEFTEKSSENKAKSQNSVVLSFPGLDGTGLPTSFTVGDSSGNLGEAYFSARTALAPQSYLGKSYVIKTKTLAANVFILQNISLDDPLYTEYSPVLAFGRSGEWVPLLTRVSKLDFQRLPSGNYLLTAQIEVESEVESSFKIVAKANGRDLELAPREVITRIVFNRNKSEVLAQAVYVVESNSNL